MQKRIFRTDAAAEYVGLAQSTLEKLRGSGQGPRFVRLSAKSVGYDLADLDKWLDSRKAESTSTPRPGA